MKKFLKHLHTVNKHRTLVFIHCCKLGIWYRGLFHDLSKYSYKEFVRSSKYYSGNYSPIINERRDNLLYSEIFIHHTRKNKHHYEYYIDEFRGDILLSVMPLKCLLEYVADTISASKTYNKKAFNREMPLEYFKKVSPRAFIHSMNIEFISRLLEIYKLEDFKGLKYKRTKKIYDELLKNCSHVEIVEVYSKTGELIKTPVDKDIVVEKFKNF